jgi:hypothetical protein
VCEVGQKLQEERSSFDFLNDVAAEAAKPLFGLGLR